MKNFEGYLKSKFGDSYVLLAGGGHKLVSDFASSTHTHDDRYILRTGDSIPGYIHSSFANNEEKGFWITQANNSISLRFTFGSSSHNGGIYSPQLGWWCYLPNGATSVSLAIFTGTATYAGDADTLDSYHANTLFESLTRPSNTNDISIKIGNSSKSITLGSRAWDSTDYLPLSGGTLTGSNNVLTLSNTSSGAIGLLFKRGSGTAWQIVDSGGNLYFTENSTNTTVLLLRESSQGAEGYIKGNLIYHAGNLPAYPTKASWNYDDVYSKLDHNHNGIYVPILSTLSGAGTADNATDLWGVRSCYDTDNGGLMALLNLNYNSANIIQLRFIVDGTKNLTHVYARGWHDQNGWQASKEFAFTSDIKDGVLSLQASGTTKTTFSANQSGSSTFNIATGSTNGTISVGGTDVAVKGLGSCAYDSTDYLPLTGGTMTGCIKRTYSGASDDPMISLASVDLDVWLWRISDSYHLTSARYGYGLKYLGTGSGTYNALALYADDNTSETPIQALYMTNNGVIKLSSTPNVNGTNVSLEGHTHTWSDVTNPPNTATRWPKWSEITDKIVSKTAWGQTYVDSSGDFQSISGNMSNVGTINSILEITTSNSAKLNITNVGNTINYLHLYVTSLNDSYSNTRPLVLLNGYGNVGVGVALPAYKLEVGGTFNATDTITLNGTAVSLLGHKHAYTELTGSGTTANQAICSSGTANGWTLVSLPTKSSWNYDDVYVKRNNDTIPGYIHSSFASNQECGFWVTQANLGYSMKFTAGSGSHNLGLYSPELGWIMYLPNGTTAATQAIFTGSANYATTAGSADYATNAGYASSAGALTTISKTAWGLTYWTSSGVPTSISGNMTDVGTINSIFLVDSSAGTWAKLNIVDYGPGIACSHMYVSSNTSSYPTSRPLTMQVGYGNVGIGTYSPAYKLEVSGSGNFTSLYVGGTAVSLEGHKHAYNTLTGSGTTANQAILSNGTTNGWKLATLGARAFDDTAYLPLTGGTLTNSSTSDGYILKINSGGGMSGLQFLRGGNTSWSIYVTGGNFYIHETYSNTIAMRWYESSLGFACYHYGSIYAPNYYTTSDRAKKQNISLFSEHIRKFQLKDTEKWHYGVIAQEVEEIFRDGEEGNMTVNYNSILSFYIGLLENRVKELEQKIKLLETK